MSKVTLYYRNKQPYLGGKYTEQLTPGWLYYLAYMLILALWTATFIAGVMGKASETHKERRSVYKRKMTSRVPFYAIYLKNSFGILFSAWSN